MFLFDVAPPVETSTIGIAVGVIFFFIAVAAGAFAFVMLRKTVKMAIRMFVVAAILVIAVVGSIALYVFMKPAPKNYNRTLPPRTSANSTVNFLNDEWKIRNLRHNHFGIAIKLCRKMSGR